MLWTRAVHQQSPINEQSPTIKRLDFVLLTRNFSTPQARTELRIPTKTAQSMTYIQWKIESGKTRNINLPFSLFGALTANGIRNVPIPL